jgi:hypothetical protein
VPKFSVMNGYRVWEEAIVEAEDEDEIERRLDEGEKFTFREYDRSFEDRIIEETDVAARTNMLYVAVDIGCIECGEPSAVFGVFDSEEAAQAACDAQREIDNGWRGGQHSYDVFAVAEMNTTYLQ